MDIRKDNSLNIYYNGDSLLKVTLSKNKINGKIHEFYLGGNGKKYADFSLEQLQEQASAIKKKITSRYSGTSESGIKARLIRASDATYIDSEFAYGETRIDLTKLENGKIVFVELKRIEDGRLLTNEYENGKPEILSQMRAYHQFIADHRAEIADYYKRLFRIKRDLGILPASLAGIDNIDDYELCKDVELYISPYTSLNSKRIRRVEAIKTILDKNGIIHNL